MSSASVAPPSHLSIAIRKAGLASLARGAGVLFACRRFLARLALLVGLASVGATSAACALAGPTGRSNEVLGSSADSASVTFGPCAWLAAAGSGAACRSAAGIASSRVAGGANALRSGFGLMRLSDGLRGCSLRHDFGLLSDTSSKGLGGLPDALRRDLPIRKLGHCFDARQAVPTINEPLVVGADQVGKLFFGREDARAGVVRPFEKREG
jgi:hypothetical protein